MPNCATCGRPHPADVTTSHHPDGCKCSSSLCGGSGPQGCIWSRVLKIPPEIPADFRRLWAMSKQAELIRERDDFTTEAK